MYHDLKAYKLSHIYLKDLEYLINKLEIDIQQMNKYSKYTSVQRILHVIIEELGYMQANRDKCKRLIATKGQIKRNE